MYQDALRIYMGDVGDNTFRRRHCTFYIDNSISTLMHWTIPRSPFHMSSSFYMPQSAMAIPAQSWRPIYMCIYPRKSIPLPVGLRIYTSRIPDNERILDPYGPKLPRWMWLPNFRGHAESLSAIPGFVALGQPASSWLVANLKQLSH